MDESAHPSKPEAEPPAPEVAQLLRLLELQAASQRQRQLPMRMPPAFQGTAFRYGSLIAIVVLALGSVGVMEWMLSQIPRPAHPAAAMASPAPTNAAAPQIKSGTPASLSDRKAAAGN